MRKTRASVWKVSGLLVPGSKPLVYRLMFPLSILIFSLMMGAGVLLYNQYDHYLYDSFTKQSMEIDHDMSVLLEQQSRGLAMSIQPIMKDSETISALSGKDKARLLSLWRDTFAQMKNAGELTHFYFLDKSRICLLRVHNPAKSGDTINRFTALEAEWSRKISSGIEIGPLGTFTLRVVQPVIVNNELIGYIELGKEIEDVLKQLHFHNDIELAVLLYKKNLKQKQWEDGMRMLGRTGDWDRLRNDVMIYSSLKNIPAEAMRIADNDVEGKERNKIFNINDRGMEYRFDTIAIKDVSGKEVGELLLLNNITNENEEFFDSAAIGGLSGAVLIGLMIGFVYLLLRRTENTLIEQEEELAMSEERLLQLAYHSKTIAWDVDENGKYTYISEFSEEIIGYQSNELIGKYFYELHPFEGREAFKKAAFEVFGRKEPFVNLKNKIVCKNGSVIWVLTNGIPLIGEDGALIGYRGNDTDITEMQKTQEQVNTLAYFDSLTSLPNRTLLMDRLHQAMAVSDRSKEYGALLIIDIDNFKNLNDTLGHMKGDELLVQISKRLRGCIREGDSVARLGGDEFVVLLVGLGDEKHSAALAAETVAHKVLALIGKPYALDDAFYQTTASVGIALFHGDKYGSDDLLKHSELAMYKSKEEGKNTLSFFDPTMEASLRERAALEEEMRSGIERGEFLLYYQPQINQEGRLCGAEALARWNHPSRGLVSPGEFIPVAESTGLIVTLGEMIVKMACEQLVSWSRDTSTSMISVAVNVSVRQFAQKDFVEKIHSAINESGADPKKLKLELTESMLVHNVDDTIEKMARLRALGIHFSLDDYGTGYSSLTYLKRLPFDQLKIDQGFVRDIEIDPNDAIICKSTIALAESMGLSVIAEGVETQEQLNLLRSFGCQAYQGYFFSPPLNVDAFEKVADSSGQIFLGEG